MDFEVIELNDKQLKEIDDRLEEFDNAHIGQSDLSGEINLGIMCDDKQLIAGVNSTVTTFRILYISTLWVNEGFRGQGLGEKLMIELENRAKKLGVSTLRADTFGFQGPVFYRKIGFMEVGSYTNDTDGYSEHFFVKHI
ncbi:MAG: GNAT family N-acetyltransferase [Defluviitaleaceae bacterium]|nr:GNAT family N-acetyltransferase [Defluviitaleaceae bacterium]